MSPAAEDREIAEILQESLAPFQVPNPDSPPRRDKTSIGTPRYVIYEGPLKSHPHPHPREHAHPPPMVHFFKLRPMSCEKGPLRIFRFVRVCLFLNAASALSQSNA
jgi:hypothetical protein